MSFVRYEQKEQYAVATIDREKALNALNSQVLEDLNTMLDGINFDEVRALIITGAGQKSFVAGADIGEMSGLSKSEGEPSASAATRPSAASRRSRSRSSPRSTALRSRRL